MFEDRADVAEADEDGGGGKIDLIIISINYEGQYAFDIIFKRVFDNEYAPVCCDDNGQMGVR